MRAAQASRLLPAESRIQVVHLGAAGDANWRATAEKEAATNPRYRWLGDVPRWKVRARFARAHLMVISSVMEGGANVVSEAVVAELPVLASDISGNRGLLGDGHPAYFPPQDSRSPCRAAPACRVRTRFPDGHRAKAHVAAVNCSRRSGSALPGNGSYADLG